MPTNFIQLNNLEKSRYEQDDDAWGSSGPHITSNTQLSQTRSVVLWIISGISLLSAALLMITSNDACTIRSNTYTPVEDIVGFKKVMFTQRLPGSPLGKFEGGSSETNAEWNSLYSYGMSKITIQQAAKLVNKTVPIPGDEDNYIILLNVFHEIHCLNFLRKQVWATGPVDPEDGALGLEHQSHCLDALRQSLMCRVDATPLPIRYDPMARGLRPSFDVHHRCRDFDAIATWAKHNQAGHFNSTIFVEDRLKGFNLG